ncbi:flavodoxin domain-containing protein [Mesotoga sp. BH458_6_3_2_1]|uniref:flavodoxin domain-containing protein n=1 Tax=Mesotoga sp. BH458_6_3_2_1 TaxID=1437446 RepID=UPI000EF1B123|nr:flavodoxin domain-containing protein [Mesotoga sp. BH458_6_3_2_1]RLL82044.1 hypothetical protein Y697_08975 [Mesotoga sp. BH458_6_3_2_1]
MKKKTLVAYATKRGSTAEIAEKIGEVLKRRQIQVDVLPVREITDLSPYKTVILGTAIYIGLWRREAVKFLKRYTDELAEMTLWIFLSGPAGEGDPLELLDGWRFPESMRPMIERIKPVEITCFGGRIESGKMNIFEKMIIKNVGAKIGDFRNWGSIASWANRID